MESVRHEHFRRHGPSLFFPIALITAGVIWLLVNNGTIPVEHVYRLAPYWPALLILGGLSLVFRQIWWPLSALMWAAAAVLVVWMLVASPNLLPVPKGVEFKEERVTEALGSAKSATVGLDLSTMSTTIHPLSDSSELIDATISHAGRLDFETGGNEQKTVKLGVSSNDPTWWFNWLASGAQEPKPWDIGLTTRVPLRLRVDASTGSTQMDLTGVQIESLTVNGSTGSLVVDLPANAQHFPFTLDASTGSTVIHVAGSTAVDMNINASTGSITIDVPDGAGVQVDVRDGGPGSLNMAGIKKVSGHVNEDEGIYENDAFATAPYPIKIVLDLSTGSFTIK
jgi:hypothetical protein